MPDDGSQGCLQGRTGAGPTASLTLHIESNTYNRYSHRSRSSVDIVTISPEFQVVVPRSIRERLNLKPSQRMQVIPYEDRIELIPLRPARELRGYLRGMSTEMTRDADRA